MASKNLPEIDCLQCGSRFKPAAKTTKYCGRSCQGTHLAFLRAFAPKEKKLLVFMRSVQKTDSCWLWTKSQDSHGYGKTTWQRRQWKAHRLSYELHVGQIPAGLELDHLCRNPLCVNPNHLEAVTRRINQLRGFSASGNNARKTHCIRGHEFSPGNTRVLPNGIWRQCKECERIYRGKRLKEQANAI